MTSLLGDFHSRLIIDDEADGIKASSALALASSLDSIDRPLLLWIGAHPIGALSHHTEGGAL